MRDNCHWAVSLRTQGNVLVPGAVGGYAHCHMMQHVVNIKMDNEIFEINQEKEKERLLTALQTLTQQMKEVLDSSFVPSDEVRSIYEMYIALSEDLTWHKNIENILYERNCTTEEAVLFSIEYYASKNPPHPLFQELENLSRHLLWHLQHQELPPLLNPFIVVGKNVGPGDVLRYHKLSVAGFVVESPIINSHAVILLKALHIPTMYNVKNITKFVHQSDFILLDNITGHIYVRPTLTQSKTDEIKATYSKFSSSCDTKDFPSKIGTDFFDPMVKDHRSSLMTLDGYPIKLFINANMVEDVQHIQHSWIEGVALYRTEMDFLHHKRILSQEEQIHRYKTILKNAQQKTVTFRFVDFGGDKAHDFLGDFHHHYSPCAYIEYPDILRTQIRSLLIAYVEHITEHSDFVQKERSFENSDSLSFVSSINPLFLTIPMIATVDEFLDIKNILQKEKIILEKEYDIAITLKIGTMLETPSSAYSIKNFSNICSHFSLGTNDLFHFFYGIPRRTSFSETRYDPLSVPFLRALKNAYDQTELVGIPITVCGNIASRVVEIMVLMSLGFSQFSLTPSSIDVIGKAIQNINLTHFKDYFLPLIYASSDSYHVREKISIRNKVEQYIIKNKTKNKNI